MGRIALHGGVVQVADINARGHIGIQVAAEIVRSTERQHAFLVHDGLPKDTDLAFDARNAVIVAADRRREGSVARDRRRGHHEAAVDVAPVILRRDTQREILENLPAQADLDLRHVAFALIDVLHASHIAPNRIVRVEILRILGTVAHRTVRREAEPEAEFLGDRHLERDIVEIERIIGRVFGHIVHLLRIVVILSLEAETEEETLLRDGAVRCRVEQIDFARSAHGHPDAAHRAHLRRTGRIDLADAVHRIGRECVNTACLGRYGIRKHHGCRDNQLNQGVLHLHCALKFYSIRKRPDYNLQISYF